MHCQLCPVPSSSGTEVEGPILAVASQEAAPGITTGTCRPGSPSVLGPKLAPIPAAPTAKDFANPSMPLTAAPAPNPAEPPEAQPWQGTTCPRQQQSGSDQKA